MADVFFFLEATKGDSLTVANVYDDGTSHDGLLESHATSLMLLRMDDTLSMSFAWQLPHDRFSLSHGLVWAHVWAVTVRTPHLVSERVITPV